MAWIPSPNVIIMAHACDESIPFSTVDRVTGRETNFEDATHVCKIILKAKGNPRDCVEKYFADKSGKYVKRKRGFNFMSIPFYTVFCAAQTLFWPIRRKSERCFSRMLGEYGVGCFLEIILFACSIRKLNWIIIIFAKKIELDFLKISVLNFAHLLPKFVKYIQRGFCSGGVQSVFQSWTHCISCWDGLWGQMSLDFYVSGQFVECMERSAECLFCLKIAFILSHRFISFDDSTAHKKKGKFPFAVFLFIWSQNKRRTVEDCMEWIYINCKDT